MRGRPDYQGQVYYAIDIEAWIPEDQPSRPGVSSTWRRRASTTNR